MRLRRRGVALPYAHLGKMGEFVMACISMADVHKTLVQEAKKKLLETARQSIYYVAFGNVMKREMTEKYELPEKDVEYLLSVACDELVRRLDKIK